MQSDDIILAIASPPGRSMRGIVRMSGSDTLRLLSKTLLDRGHQPLPQQRGVYRAQLLLNDRPLPLLALLMPGPHSYTGEDTAELQLPGNPALLEQAMQQLEQTAASLGIAIRRAEGGEFTARAYFNNRLSLTEAEGVAATIAAQSDAELRAAGMLRSGSLGTLAHSLADDLASALALVEAGIDFTDQDDVIAISPRDLRQRLSQLLDALNGQLDRAVGMEALEAIPWVVLTGPPNAGKSTLFNALLGRQRAVVSDVAGTTRDVLTQPLHVPTAQGDAEVMLVDVAGIETIDHDAASLDGMMQQQARRALQRAELVLDCRDVATGPAPERDDRTLAVRTKCDNDNDASNPSEIAVSAHTGRNLDALRDAIAMRLRDRAVSLAADVFALTPRHEAAMRSAAAHLREAHELVSAQGEARALAHAELVAAAMRAALDDFAALAGDITPDDVLGRVFSTFCVGK